MAGVPAVNYSMQAQMLQFPLSAQPPLPPKHGRSAYDPRPQVDPAQPIPNDFFERMDFCQALVAQAAAAGDQTLAERARWLLGIPRDDLLMALYDPMADSEEHESVTDFLRSCLQVVALVGEGG